MRSVICYFHHVSHVLNLGSIPDLLKVRGWQVRCFCAFSADVYPLARAPGIEYRFDVPLSLLESQEADLYLTPLVGQATCFPKRALRVHFLVSLVSLEGVYDASMFDHYDAIACAGRNHIEEFLALGKARGWQGKVLMSVGYPKLDGQRKLLGYAHSALPNDPVTVVFAPTHAYYANSQFSVLGQYGEPIVEALITAGIKVVFRPHMESWRDQDRPVVERIVSRFNKHDLFSLDRSANYHQSYAKSHLMLTDISGTGFTYAFAFSKPALFFAPDLDSEAGKVGIQFECRENIGLVIRNLSELVERVRLVMLHMAFVRQQVADFRDWLIFNPESSENYFASNIEALFSERMPADWVRM